jgi:serine protease AprX
MHRARLITTTVTALALALLLTLLPPASADGLAAAYVEPGLAATTTDNVAVIVTAGSAENAAAAVVAVGGTVSSELWLIDAVAARVPAAAIATLIGRPSIVSVVANKGVQSSDWDGWVTDRDLPAEYDGRPDVQPTDDPVVWDIVNPVAIDIGADVLHETALPSGEFIKGNGVTVAVLDSGVYFDTAVRAELGDVVEEHFIGQADFVDRVCARELNERGRLRRVGVQRKDYCFVDHNDTADGYGHGTAVASIIWNNFTDANTGVSLGIAPEANILSVRVLDNDGVGTYETVIQGIQHVVRYRNRHRIQVLNMSISAEASTPYFVDPLNRAVEMAWLRGITVLAAAGNSGPDPSSITVPGNDPYIITVGALDEQRTPGYWTDDTLPEWSATGPTLDGFVKPDLLAPGVNIITFMHKNLDDPALSQKIVQMHPDFSAGSSLFRMNGTSMSTAIASGVTALMLQAEPDLEPDEVKYRLLDTARPAAVGAEPELVYTAFRQGMGRIWAPDAVLGEFPAAIDGNPDMDLRRDLRSGMRNERQLAAHYQGPVQTMLSDDGTAYLYYIELADGRVLGLGAFWADGSGWIDRDTLAEGRLAWSGGRLAWSGGRLAWSGGFVLPEGRLAWSGGRLAWSGGRLAWSGGRLAWSGDMPFASGRLAWSGGRLAWSGGMSWIAQPDVVADSGRLAWSGHFDTANTHVAATRWVGDE